jgi:hypothetical protein
LKSATGWLLMATVACAAAHAAQPPPPPQKPAPATAGQPSAPPGEVPDDEFIEFLGSDDVGDAAWWEFLKRVPPRGSNPPAPPPQDANR